MSVPGLLSADRIAPAAVRWLWDGWLPAGKLVVLDGAPEVGKSTLMSDLAAKLSSGRLGGEPAATVFVTVEESAGDAIVPRLVAAGADLSKVHVWRAPDEFTLPERIDLLAEVVRDTGAKLVVLDPVSDFLDVSMAHEQSVRRALRALAGLAEATGCTVLVIRHLCKQERGPAIYRGLGSVGILAAARVVWLLGHHPGGEGRRVLMVIKSNVADRPAAKVFRLKGGCVEWSDEADWLAAEDVRAAGEPSQAAWLRTQLARGPKKAQRLLAEAQVLGMSVRTVQRAKKALQIVSKRYFNVWYWCLPGQDPQERYSGLRPMDEVEPYKAAVLEPVPPEEQLEPMEDVGTRLRVPEGASERQIFQAARKALRGVARKAPPASCSPQPPLPKGERGSKGGQGSGSGGLAPPASCSPRPPLPKGERGSKRGQGSGNALTSSLTAPPSPALGEGGRGGEGEPSPAPDTPGSRRFDPAPAGTLDVVVRLDDGDAGWAAVVDRVVMLDELVKGRVGPAASLDWEPAWTGPVGDGRLRLVLAPRQVPPERLGGLAAWAQEALAPCESARLAA